MLLGGCEGGRYVGLTMFMYQFSGNLGASPSWNPRNLSRYNLTWFIYPIKT
jgi:hypothetical protein